MKYEFAQVLKIGETQYEEQQENHHRIGLSTSFRIVWRLVKFTAHRCFFHHDCKLQRCRRHVCSNDDSTS